MRERELHIAREIALVLEERLTAEITGEHEIYIDYDVTDEGQPFVALSVSGRDGVKKLSALFGEAIGYRSGAIDIEVPVFFKELKPAQAMN